MMKKHAYLIMAHNDWELLSGLLKCIDDARNAIFLHIDKKAAFDPSMIYLPQKAEFTIIHRKKVHWGGYSQIAVELDLLSAAIGYGNFEYYHLLSGQDLPLKSQDYINDFFDQNNGRNFISFDSEESLSKALEKRIEQYHFLRDKIDRKNTLWFNALRKLERLSIHLQRMMGVNRLRKYPDKMYKGANWFSITDELAKYVVSRKKYIRKWFKYSFCADELFLQTISMQSPMRDTIVKDCLREIDWKRGSPYTYRQEDEEMLCGSPKLFARKFSTGVDKVIIQRMVDRLIPE